MGINEWIRTNITGSGDGDFSRATDTSKTTSKEDITFEVPDFPSPPEQGQSMPDYLKGTLFESVQSFILSVVAGVLSHIVERPDPEKKK